MSARQPRKPKNVKPAVIVTKDVAPAPVAVAAPAPAPVAVAAPAAPVATTANKTKKPVPEGHLDSHRVRKSIDALINSVVNEQKAPLQRDIKLHDAAVKALKEGTVKETAPGATAEDPKKTVVRAITEAERAEFTATVNKWSPGHKERLDRLALFKSAKLRISPDVSVLIRYALEQIVREGAIPALDTAKAEKLKKATISHFHTERLTSLPSYALLRRSATFRNTSEQLRAEREAADRINQIKTCAKQAVSDFKKNNDIHVPRSKKQAPIEAPAEPAAAEPVKVAPTRTPQTGSIDQLAKEIADKYGVEGMSLSGELRRHFGDIINDVIADFSGIMLNLVTAHDNKTVTKSIAMSALALVYTQGFTPVNKVELVDGQVPNPAIVEAEKAKKAAAKKENKTYKIDYSAIPLVPGKVVTHKVEFPGSNWDALRTQLLENLAANTDKIEAERAAKREKKAAKL